MIENKYIKWLSDYAKRLRDVRILGLHIFVAIAILVTWNSVGVIQDNYELQKKVARLQQENNIDKLENENLQLRNQYFETEQYLEIAARRQFSKAELGETLLLVPETIARKHSSPEKQLQQDTAAAPSNKPQYQQNLEAWMEFFFRRNIDSV